jgi:peptidoglycan/LPS O-acetylase OafA/YrhL/lysophospholipase L1-like esterase
VADQTDDFRAVFPAQQTSHPPPSILCQPLGQGASVRGRHRASLSVRGRHSGRGTAGVQPGGAPRYLPGLDGLRAVAVLAVVAYHQDLAWAPGGFLGVDIFFVVSGYLITGILRADWDRRGGLDLRRFWTRRARLLLPALAVMVAAVCTAATVLDRGQLPALRADVAAAATYTSNWWQITAHHSYLARFSPPSLLQHLWSLAVEEQFYLLWPLLLALGLRYLPRRGLALTIAGAAACSAVAMATLYHPRADPSRVYFGTDTHALGLLLGAALALYLPPERLAAHPRARTRRLLDAAGALTAAAVAAGIVGLHQLGAVTYRGGLGLVAVATAGLIIVAACPATRTARILGLRPLRWVGARSYALYLWHWPVLVLARHALGPTAAARASARVGTAALALGLAAVSWTLVEHPIRTRGLTACLRRLVAGRHQGSRARTGRRVFVAGVATIALGVLAVGIAGLVLAPAPEDAQAQISAGIRAVGAPAPAPPPATGSSPGVTGSSPTPPVTSAPAGPPPGTQVTAIGDSVMLASATALQARLPGITIDAAVSRQMIAAPQVIAELRATGRLRPIIVLGLGTNGPFTPDQLDRILDALGPDHRVVLVNVYVPDSWQDEVDAVLDGARARPGVSIADWHDLIAAHTALLYPDGTHPRPDGAALYADMIADIL